MTNLAIWTFKPYDNDALFEPDSLLNRDNCLAPLHALHQEVVLHGGQCHTQDVYLNKNIIPDIVLFLDIPKIPVERLLAGWNKKSRAWLVLQECSVVVPRNWDLKLHSKFEKIFTWDDEFVDNKKYFKLNFSNSFLEESDRTRIVAKEKFCTLIAGNKVSYKPLELYSKRVEAIRWFEKNHPDEFDLFGIGWDRPFFSGMKLAKQLNKSKLLRKLFAPAFPSYRGRIDSKRPVLDQYKFSICYENARDISGYITEKIFDCFFSGCIPVYWGAHNVSDHIPKECFIDRRDFSTYDELYSFMKNMDNESYESYLLNIHNYIASNKSYEFTDRYFAKTIVNEITHE